MATNYSRKIGVFFSEIFYCCTAIQKPTISERRWAAYKGIDCGYILYEYGEVWCSNSRETFAQFCTSMKKNAKMGVSGRLSQNKLD